MLAELAEPLGVDRTTVLKRCTALGIIQKQGHWAQFELKSMNM